MNVLLTGGMGYIGSHTAVTLAAAGHKVVLYDNLCNSSASVTRRIAEIVGQEVPFIHGDIRDTALLYDTLRDEGIEAVIHFAGLKAVGESVDQPINYYANNVQGTISLLQAMHAAGLTTLVFSSSATVYGDPQYLPIDEAHPTSPINPYGRTKVHIEELLRDVSISDTRWRVCCLRYFNPVGAHSSGLIGEDPSGVPNNLMPYVAQVAVRKRDRLKVFGNDYNTADGTGVRDYIHVMDLAEGHLAALKFLQLQSGWHAINLGTGRGHSVLEMIRAFEAASGNSIPFQIVPRRTGDIATCFAKVDSAWTRLGWKAERTIEDMCSSAWYRQVRLESQWIGFASHSRSESNL